MQSCMFLVAALGTPARAAPPVVTLAVGAREDFTEGSFVEGGAAGVRLSWGLWELGVSQYVRLDGIRPSGLTSALASLAWRADPDSSFVQPEDVDTAATAAWVALGPSGDGSSRWWGAPRLLAGLEARWVNRTAYGPDPEANAEGVVPAGPSEAFFGVGPFAGAAFDARLGSPLGLRLAVVDRTWFGPEFDFSTGTGDGRRVYHDPTVTLDLTWSL
jgi:hypothetical protein